MEKTAQEMAAEIKTTLASLTNELEAVKGKKTATPEEVQAAKDALENFKNENNEQLKAFAKADELAQLKQDFDDVQAELKALQEKGKEVSEIDAKEILSKTHGENKEKIRKAISNSGNNPAEFAVKANVFTTSVANNTRALRISGATELAIRKLSLKDIFRTETLSPDNSGVIRYTDWDEATIDRAAATIAEGGVFPESTAAFVERSERLRKIGDTIPVSEEFGVDERRFVGEVEDFLAINVALEEDAQLYDGDNTGENLNGVYTTAPVFDPTLPALAPVFSGIQNANLYDLIVKTKEFISRGRKSKFNPDFVILNQKQINDLMLTKNEDNDYLQPPFAIMSDGTMMIGGCMVVESNNVAENTMVVGDSRYGKIYEGDSYTLTTGYVNGQFGEDLVTLKARKRMLLLIKELDRQGFAKVEDVAGAIAQLSS